VKEKDGSTKDLTPGEKTKAQFADWAGDLKSFSVLTNERDPQYFDLYRYAVDGYAREMVFKNDGGFNVSEFSRDGRWVALAKIRNNADSNLYVVDLKSAKPEPILITPHEGNINHAVAAFTPDSKALYYKTNAGSEFDAVRSCPLADAGNAKTGHALVEQAPWDVLGTSFSWDGKLRVTAINADARTQVKIVETSSGKSVALPEFPRADIAGLAISRSGKKIAFYVNGDTSPSNLHVLDVATGKATWLTDTLNPAIQARDLVESQNIRYKSFDELEVPALLYKPHGASASSRVPALVMVHGGPGGQSRTGYNANLQFLVNQGYAVLAVNNRGSSGYGKTFFHADDRNHGENDLQDCVYGRRYLEKLDWVDARKIGIIGGSYGGFMVCAALTLQPDAFDVGINIFGVTNWLRTLKSIPPWWADFKESLYAEMGDPDADKERLTRISPLFQAKNIKKPFLVFQGANDPRVLKVESDEIVEAAKKNGVPVEYVIFPDEGHGFAKKENRITAAETQAAFLDKYLRSAENN
jgi:dipeptidyl aminopeptidase/acylaminoacyl peptidase